MQVIPYNPMDPEEKHIAGQDASNDFIVSCSEEIQKLNKIFNSACQTVLKEYKDEFKISRLDRLMSTVRRAWGRGLEQFYGAKSCSSYQHFVGDYTEFIYPVGKIRIGYRRIYVDVNSFGQLKLTNASKGWNYLVFGHGYCFNPNKEYVSSESYFSSTGISFIFHRFDGKAKLMEIATSCGVARFIFSHSHLAKSNNESLPVELLDISIGIQRDYGFTPGFYYWHKKLESGTEFILTNDLPTVSLMLEKQIQMSCKIW